MHVEVLGLRHSFGDRVVFDGLSCQFGQGEITCILGASGVGKSTLLRMLATLLVPASGQIWVGGEETGELGPARLRALRRRIGMMFQGGALLDSMSVFENTALPLREHTDLAPDEIADRVHAQFHAVGLDLADHLLPAQISGGMRKRLALARAMIIEPDVLLCDEPFSGLDPIAVRLIEALLVETKQRTGVTLVLTNHHIGSTLRMADQIVFLVGGGTVCGTVREFQASIDPRVTAFLDAASPGYPERGRARGTDA